MSRLPTFLIIGAAKAGTTAVYGHLRQHPDVYMSPVKEPRFFAYEGGRPDFQGPRIPFDPDEVHDLPAYLRLFEHAGDRKAVGEASVTYLYWPLSAGRILRSIPDARLIVLLRHPAGRAYSQFMHARRDGIEPLADFHAALDAEPGRIRDNWAPFFFYASRSLYVPQLRRYLDLFPREQIRIHLFEDLRTRPLEVMADLFAHIGVDPSFQPGLDTQYNESGLPRFGRLYRFADRAGLLLRRAAEQLPLTRRLVTGGFLARVGSVVRSAQLSKPPMPPSARARLIEYCRDDVLALQDILHRDLSFYLR